VRDVPPANVDALRVLCQRGDRFAEEVLDVEVGGFVQNPRQVSAQNLDVGDDAAGVAGQVVSPVPQPPIGAVDGADTDHPGVVGADLVHQAHAFDHVPSGAAQVDRLTTRSERGGTLDDGDLESVVTQPVRERRPGDARAGNQNILHAYNVQTLCVPCKVS
jgi:hypothetical protein